MKYREELSEKDINTLDMLINQFSRSDEEFFEDWKDLCYFYKGIGTAKKNCNEVGVCDLLWVRWTENETIKKELKKLRTTPKDEKYFFNTKEERLKALKELLKQWK